MTQPTSPLESRRALLRFLAGSPLVYGLGELGFGLEQALAQADSLISDPEHAVNVFDFENYVKENMQVGHYTYMAYGSDDSSMLAVNREGYRKIRLRPRRLIDVSSIDMSVELFGQRYDMPIFCAPCGAQGAFHPEGEVAVARAAKSANTLQILSTVTNHSVEDVVAARGAPVWYQLYPTTDWNLTRHQIERAEHAGCTALALTVDIVARNMEESARLRRHENPACIACHEPNPGLDLRLKPMFDGFDTQGIGMGIGGLTWDYVDRLKDTTSMNVLVKGIVTAEDAVIALERGADGIIVSNHGGRAESSGVASVESLREVVNAVQGRVPVLVDGGIRRGTDAFKALALGADAVCIGRPYLWGLGAFGEAGVARVLEILERELRIVMQQMGTRNLRDITPRSVQV
ncbi:MAG: alpha-hydroxy-acid oxidizing protein [Gammaproteobacteria bacterium]|nr:alpha-hydroxy-acid oxidizing protein [Gammaproteobacteria bacterium]